MYLENLVFDARDPQRLGRFWEAAVGGETLTDEADAYETRLVVDGGPVLDLCFQWVAEPPSEPARLHLDLLGGDQRDEVVQRLLGLGARHVDIGQGGVPWVVLADPEGNAFCVMEPRETFTDTGPIAAVPVDSADPARDAEFWSWLTGWVPTSSLAPTTVRHPTRRGLLLQFCPEPRSKPESKNRLHLDVRLEGHDDPEAVAAGIAERGGREWFPDWGQLPWRQFRDPSDNEFCLLPARETAAETPGPGASGESSR